ncbi:MAG: cytochrome c-type biogenesis protein CcmH [Aquabacterium sp.]|uniref:cytochrome c-type biogenesis protein n=1 Tax=Aquabacterium sp. TaxID=1872578 RepID=UPI0012153DD3|nr:cytochrome c-type biogenesis protein [Aquabacterium sp.]TAK99666.1 MAG: cytochrome c-type biogenesis protein CcmH [Aquabacterium sp.]
MADLRCTRWCARLASGLAVQLSAVVASAAVAATAPGSAELDEHVNRVTSELRCLVCQNQTIADSQAELAVQLKNEVRQQLAAGATDDQVKDFMVQRYGDFVLYRPPVNQSTLLLWAGPLLLLTLGLTLFVWHWRERRQAQADASDSVVPVDEVLP